MTQSPKNFKHTPPEMALANMLPTPCSGRSIQNVGPLGISRTLTF
jgi:hypothetical protein